MNVVKGRDGIGPLVGNNLGLLQLIEQLKAQDVGHGRGIPVWRINRLDKASDTTVSNNHSRQNLKQTPD